MNKAIGKFLMGMTLGIAITGYASAQPPDRKPLPKVYFFNTSFYWDDGKSVEEEADQPVNEFYRSSAGLTAVIYLPKGLHPEKYYDDRKFSYRFEVYGDVYDSDGETHVGTYTVVAEPRQRKIWKFLPLGDLDGQKFTVRVYEGDHSAKPIAEGKVRRTQTR